MGSCRRGVILRRNPLCERQELNWKNCSTFTHLPARIFYGTLNTLSNNYIFVFVFLSERDKLPLAFCGHFKKKLREIRYERSLYNFQYWSDINQCSRSFGCIHTNGLNQKISYKILLFHRWSLKLSREFETNWSTLTNEKSLDPAIVVHKESLLYRKF